MNEREVCDLLVEIGDGCLMPALNRAASVEGVPASVLVVAQFEAALTSCFAMAKGDVAGAVKHYRKYVEDGLEWYDRVAARQAHED